ncbi:MAG: hypothetical protein JWR75_960 [Devosia sp.]|nr:hypothetical protein [Devosia sp.]
MAQPRPPSKTWRFSTSIFAPVIVSLVATAIGVVAFVLWSTANIDQRSLQRETQSVEYAIGEILAGVPREQESVTVWDDAIIQTKFGFNQNWVHVNLGLWMHDFFGHDRTFVLDPSNTPVYAMDGGKLADTELFTADAAAFEPLIAELRGKIAAGLLDNYNAGTAVELAHAVDVTTVSGHPAIVSIAPIISDSSDIFQVQGTEFLHISVVFLNQAFAQKLARTYHFEASGFSTNQPSDGAQAVYPILSKSGRFVTFFEWRQDRPGARMLSQTAPVLAGAFLVAGVLVFLLLDQLWRSTQALETGHRRAQHQATHDSLTGLPNRTLFEDRLDEVLAERTAGERTAVMMLDLDRFKQVNDTLGHAAGDELIRAAAERLRQLLPPEDTIARLGGDEFGVIHPLIGPEGDAMVLAGRLVAALARPFEISVSETHIGGSIGVVIFDSTSTRGTVARNADIALYEAKSAGRNRAVLFEERMNEVLQLRRTIEMELREALRRPGQITVQFQPLYNACGKSIIGAEALARWEHPKFGSISPAKFIPVAESSGLIENLGEYVLRRACELGARWPDRTIAVNISPVQLRNPGFSRLLFDILKQTGMLPSCLELEITENILIDDESQISDTLRTFRAAGIRIALDDFGTGYSSLNYLKRYAVDRIKVDRSFVQQLPDDAVSYAIVQAMVMLAKAMGISVTAEGVELESQRRVLEKLGCDVLQGFLFSPAIVEFKLEALFRGDNVDHYQQIQPRLSA